MPRQVMMRCGYITIQWVRASSSQCVVRETSELSGAAPNPGFFLVLSMELASTLTAVRFSTALETARAVIERTELVYLKGV